MEISFDFRWCRKTVGCALTRLLNKKQDAEQIIKDSFIHHPFRTKPFKPPIVLKVFVRTKTHSPCPKVIYIKYPQKISLFLYVNNYWGYPNWTEAMDRFVSMTPFSRKGLQRILFHEFGHVYDAIFDKDFGYDEKQKPRGDPRRIFFNLWNCYIDGRLANRAPDGFNKYCNNRRWQEHPKICTYQKRAYLREFNTFKLLLQATYELWNSREVIHAP